MLKIIKNNYDAYLFVHFINVDNTKDPEQRIVKIGSDTAGCVWAPEAIYDEKADDFLVYWT